MTKTRSRKALYIGLPLALVVALGSAAGGYLYWKQNAGYPRKIVEQARDLHEHMLSFDGHITVPLSFGTHDREADKDGPYQFDLVKAGKGRLSGAALTILAWPEMWNGPNAPHKPTAGFVDEARQQQQVRYQIISNLVRDFPNQVGIAYTPDDFRRLNGEGKFAVFISLLNAYPLGDDLSQLDLWARRGMRMFGFSYIGNNDWADSSRPMPFFNDSADALGGLAPIGEQAVARLNDLGVIIDVSQMSTLALADVARLSRAPIVASHSAPRGLLDIRRNLGDHEMKLIKDSGGLIQVVGFSGYLKRPAKPVLDKLEALRARFDLGPLNDLNYALMPGDPAIAIWSEQRFGEYASSLYGILEEDPKATLKTYVDAIDYTVKKVGIDHVGISSDFNEGGGLQGWKDVSEIRNVTAELLTRGYSETDIAKLWAGNFLRVWGQVQQAARPVATTTR